jgi:hypothetical protein
VVLAFVFGLGLAHLINRIKQGREPVRQYGIELLG